MGNHYLPQHYLLGFSDGKKLWGHDLTAGRSFPTQVKSVANETEMYTSEVETHLANVVEGPAQEVIDRIRNRIPLSNKDREIFAKYVVAMWKRVPAGRNRVAGHIPQLAETIRVRVINKIESLARAEPELADMAEKRKEEVNAIISSYKENLPDYFWHQTLRSGATPKTIQGLLSMDWCFLVTTGEHFLTCDNPVFFFESEGIGADQAELSMPLSSEICFWARRSSPNRPQYFSTERSTVLELNRRSAHNTVRFLYTRMESPWILEFAQKKHRLRRLL